MNVFERNNNISLEFRTCTKYFYYNARLLKSREKYTCECFSKLQFIMQQSVTNEIFKIRINCYENNKFIEVML